MKKAKSTKRTKKLQSVQPAMLVPDTQKPKARLEDKPIPFYSFGRLVGCIDMAASIITEYDDYGLEARG